MTWTLAGSTFEETLRIALALTFVILFVSIKLYSLIYHKSEGHPRDILFVKECFLSVVSSFTQRAWHIDPHSASLKIKCWVGFAFGMVCFTAYSASIVSSLATSRVPMRTFHDLISAQFLLTVHEKSYTFQNLVHGLITTNKLNQNVELVSTVEEVSHLFDIKGDTVTTTRKAFLSFADMFYQVAVSSFYSQHFLCEHISAVKLPSTDRLTMSAMLVMKASPFKEILNYMYDVARIFITSQKIIMEIIYNIVYFL